MRTRWTVPLLLAASVACGCSAHAGPSGPTAAPSSPATPGPLVAGTSEPGAGYDELAWTPVSTPATGTSVVVRTTGGGCDGSATLARVEESTDRVVLHVEEKPYAGPCSAVAWAEDRTVVLPEPLGKRQLVHP